LVTAACPVGAENSSRTRDLGLSTLIALEKMWERGGNSVGTGAWAWGNRKAIRIDAAALIVNSVLDLAGFVQGSFGIRVLSAAIVLLSLPSVVLMLRCSRPPVAITD
jgi:hypothetical protein